MVLQDTDSAIKVLKEVAHWMTKAGLGTGEWWDPNNMNIEFLGRYAKPDEFFVAFVNDIPAAAAIIQQEQTAQDWSSVDGDKTPQAIYVHWLAVKREFAGQGLSETLINHACELASNRNISTIRLDTDADEPKLCKLYESLGFKKVATIQEDQHVTALYEKTLG